MRHLSLLAFFSFPLLYGCGNAINCALNGDNIEGRITFPQSLPAESGKNIIVEYSTNGFASVQGSKSIRNLQGFITVPYSYCADSDVDFSVRAFQDSNGNGTWDSGEGSGREDGTTDGNATYKVHHLPKPQPSATPPVEWKIDRGADIWIDSSTGQ